MTLHSCRNGVLIPFLQEWSGHSIPTGMECSFHSCRNGMTSSHSCKNKMTSFHSSQNGITTPFLQECNEHSILAGRKLPFNSIPVRMESRLIPFFWKYTIYLLWLTEWLTGLVLEMLTHLKIRLLNLYRFNCGGLTKFESTFFQIGELRFFLIFAKFW